jgi:hypothetical protein
LRIFHNLDGLNDKTIKACSDLIQANGSQVTKIVSKSTKKTLKTTKENSASPNEPYIIRIEEEILDADKVASLLSASKKVIERELREGKMQGYKRLNKWFVLKSDLVRYIREAEKE